MVVRQSSSLKPFAVIHRPDSTESGGEPEPAPAPAPDGSAAIGEKAGGDESSPDRRASGVAARESGDLHRILVDAVRDYAIFALDPRGYIITWNAGAEALKGYTPREAIGLHFSIFYPRDLVVEGFPEFELRTAANVGRFENEGWRVRKDGTRFWANVVITALRDPTGGLIGFAKVTRDLTDRRNAEEALRASEESFRLLVDGVKDYAIFMLDPTGRIVTWNEGAERIKGYRREEIVGQSFSKFYLPEDIASGKPERALEIAARTGKYEEEGRRVRQDGTLLWASVLLTALRNEAGDLIGFAKVTRDLTERRASERRALEDAQRMAADEAARREAEAREQELRDLAAALLAQTAEAESRRRDAEAAQQRADVANRVKSDFLASMSHELRTPLNAIGGYADLLTMGLSGSVTPQQIEQLGRIKRSQEHLLGIINDILNFSRIEAGQLTYELRPVVVCDVMDGVAQMIAPQMQQKGLVFEEIIHARDVVALADGAKVEQIVLNLVSNAMKFTDPGGRIAVSCEQISASEVAIQVRDTGCGIPENHLQAIFEPFVQVGRSLTTTRHGTGLGLAISRDLALGMGGDLTVESTVDVGSTFTLTLPAAP
jgi:PAS domain S-box-containing protein